MGQPLLFCADDTRSPIIHFDLLGWREGKYQGDLTSLSESRHSIALNIKQKAMQRIQTFNDDFGDESPEDYYYHAVDFVQPRARLNYDLEYA